MRSERSLNELVNVSENLYKDFLRWGNYNIEGFHYEVITVADSVV